MKINKSIFFLIASIILSGCKVSDVPQTIPSCIKEEIKSIQSTPVRNPAGSVWQYEYKGKTVYYIPSYCCDIPGKILDTNCNIICMPEGGFTGAGDGKCPDFLTERKNEKLIWKDTRK